MPRRDAKVTVPEYQHEDTGAPLTTPPRSGFLLHFLVVVPKAGYNMPVLATRVTAPGRELFPRKRRPLLLDPSLAPANISDRLSNEVGERQITFSLAPSSRRGQVLKIVT